MSPRSKSRRSRPEWTCPIGAYLYRNEGIIPVSAQAVEDELLRSIEEVEDRIKIFRNRVKAVLAAAQNDGSEEGAEEAA